MSQPSIVTSAARILTTLPVPDPTRRGRPRPTRRRGRSMNRSPAKVPGPTSTVSPLLAASIRAWSGESSLGDGRPSSVPGSVGAISSPRRVSDTARMANAAKRIGSGAGGLSAEPPREKQGEREADDGQGEGVGPEPGVRVDAEIGQLLEAKERRHEGGYLHRGRRRQVVSVAPELVAERPERERAEIAEEDEDVDEVRDLPEDRGPQEEQPHDADHEGNPLELGEVGRLDVLHPDVVVQDVDLLDVLPLVAPLEAVAVDVHPKPFRVLRGEHRQLPEGEDIGEDEEERGDQQEDTGRRSERLIEEPCLFFEERCHSGSPQVRTWPSR